MNSSRIISLISHTLLIGLFIHFVVITWLEYRMGLTGTMLTVIALWKEIVLVIWAARLGITQHKHIHTLWKSDIIFRSITIILFATIASTAIVSVIGGYSLSSYIAAAKYNLIGFGVGCHIQDLD